MEHNNLLFVLLKYRLQIQFDKYVFLQIYFFSKLAVLQVTTGIPIWHYVAVGIYIPLFTMAAMSEI